MSKKYAFLFPGQGAQYPGMGRDFYDHYPVARETFEEADDLLGQAISKLIFQGPSEELTLTKNSQTAIYITSIAILRTFQQQFPHLTPTVCAGLSLGEYTALTAAGKVEFADCLDLVRIRAQAMHLACKETSGSMQVVLGMEPSKIEEILHSLQVKAWIANLNCPGQVVIAGTTDALTKAADSLKKEGAKRVLPLEVSGAFHSQLMQSAKEALIEKIGNTPFYETPIRIVMNVSAREVPSSTQMRQMLAEQVVSPVLWERSVRTISETGIDSYIEMGPGKSLAAMNKRIGVSGITHSIEKITDLEAFYAALTESYATIER